MKHSPNSNQIVFQSIDDPDTLKLVFDAGVEYASAAAMEALQQCREIIEKVR